MVLEAREDIKEIPYYFEVNCDYCGKPFITTRQRYDKNKTQCCSRECMGKLHRAKPNCECVVCGKKIHRKPNQLKKIKNVTCSYECRNKLKKETISGENNHQYGLRGKLNSSYKNGEIITHYGYKKIKQWEHPLCDCEGYVFEHRLIADKYLLDEFNSVEINGHRYLSKKFDVHHIDFNRLNNNIENLCILTKADHRLFHNKINPTLQDEKTGQFIGRTYEYKNLTKDELKNSLFNFINNKGCYYKIIETDTLTETERGDGGFGSTGV